MCSTLAALDADLHESFLVLEEAARQNAAGAGAKDLQRLQLHQQRLVVAHPVAPVLQLLPRQQREAARVPAFSTKS